MLSIKEMDGYYTPIEVEEEYELKRSTLRKYSLLIDERANEPYFRQEKINGRATRIYNISEILMLKEVYRLSVTDRVDLKDAIELVFFSQDTEDNEPKDLADIASSSFSLSEEALHNLLEHQNNLLLKQHELINHQAENLDKLIVKLEQLLPDSNTITIEPAALEPATGEVQAESQPRFWQKVFKKK